MNALRQFHPNQMIHNKGYLISLKELELVTLNVCNVIMTCLANNYIYCFIRNFLYENGFI